MALVKNRRMNWGKATVLFYKELEQLKAEKDRGLSPVPPREPTTICSPCRGECGRIKISEFGAGVGLGNSTPMPTRPVPQYDLKSPQFGGRGLSPQHISIEEK
jgi:hypothetical protein